MSTMTSARTGAITLVVRLLFACAVALLAASCSGPSNKAEEAPKPCDQRCRDESATRALRETLKLVFNLALQGKPVGAQDATAPCPLGGSARVRGTVTSNAIVGTNEVKLTYTLDGCAYLLRDDEPKNNYRMSFTGTLTQEGVMAVQPTITSALVMKSDAMKLSGTVYEPPIPYEEPKCAVSLGQNGNQLFGTVCERSITLSL
jgi:hypothetical protein